MYLLAQLVDLVVNIYIFIIVISVVVHWLIAFNVMDARNPQAQNLIDLLKRATDPVMKPIQKYIPPIGGIDVTPIIVIILLELVRGVLVKFLMSF